MTTTKTIGALAWAVVLAVLIGWSAYFVSARNDALRETASYRVTSERQVATIGRLKEQIANRSAGLGRLQKNPSAVAGDSVAAPASTPEAVSAGLLQTLSEINQAGAKSTVSLFKWDGTIADAMKGFLHLTPVETESLTSIIAAAQDRTDQVLRANARLVEADGSKVLINVPASSDGEAVRADLTKALSDTLGTARAAELLAVSGAELNNRLHFFGAEETNVTIVRQAPARGDPHFQVVVDNNSTLSPEGSVVRTPATSRGGGSFSSLSDPKMDSYRWLQPYEQYLPALQPSN